MTITGEQVKEARKLLGWSRIELMLASGIGSGVIKVFETSKHVQPRDVATALRRALKSAGIVFVEENGEEPRVRLRKAI
jgi:hypothetical protein